MKVTLEQLGRMKARRTQANSRRDGRTTAGLRWLQPVLLVLGLLFVVTFIADMVSLSRGGKIAPTVLSIPEEIQQLERDLATGPYYSASNGLFRIVQPRGWKVLTGETIAPHDIMFVSPNGVSLSLSVTPVTYNELPTLFAEMSQREREFGVRSDIQTLYFRGNPAARREVKMIKTEALVTDFVTNHIAHQIFCEVPQECYELYRPALLKLIETYQPLSITQR